MDPVNPDVAQLVWSDGFEFEFEFTEIGCSSPDLSPDEPDGWCRGGGAPPTADDARVVKNPPLYGPNRCLPRACHLILY